MKTTKGNHGPRQTLLQNLIIRGPAGHLLCPIWSDPSRGGQAMPSQEGTKKKAWGFSLWVSSLSLKALPGVTSSEADPFLPWHPLCHTRLCHVLIPYGVGTGKAALQDTAWKEVFRPAWPSRHPENPSGRSQEDREPEGAGARTAPSTAHAPPPAETREGPAPPQVSRRRRLCDVVPEAARAARGGSRSRLPFAAGPPLEGAAIPRLLGRLRNQGPERRREDFACSGLSSAGWIRVPGASPAQRLGG